MHSWLEWVSCTPSREFTESLNIDENIRFEVFTTKPTIYSKAPYQRKIAFMRYRLQQNLDKTRARIYQDEFDESAWPHAYKNENDFLHDLYVIRDSLYSHGDQKIASLVRGGTIEGISDLRDESDREGMRIVVVLKRDAFPQVVLNKLYSHTFMQSTFGVINLALVENQPKVMSLKETMQEFLKFREEVVVRRTRYELRKAEERAHILEGYRIALDHIDEVIALIRASETTEAARNGLMEKFGLSEKQAQAILELRLQRLTGLERDKIEAEYQELIQEIERHFRDEPVLAGPPGIRYRLRKFTSRNRGPLAVAAVVAAAVMNSGLLANPTPEAKFDYAPAPPELLARALAMKAACERHGVSLRAAALQFVFGHPLVVSVVAGVRSVAHLDDAITNLHCDIPASLWDELRAEGLLPEDVPTP